MAKKSLLGTMLTIGGIAAATYVAYQKREEIRALVNTAVDRFFPAEQEPEDVEFPEEETDIVIDATEAAEPAGTEAETEVVEETGEA